MDPQHPSASVDPVRLSKLLAFTLRHRPDALGIELDPEGWVELDVLVAQINTHRRLPTPVKRDDLERLALGEGCGRFELRGGRLRARGGHSVAGVNPLDELDEAAPTPEFLFIGVDAAALLQAEGIGYLEGDGGTPLRLHDDEAAGLDGDPGREVVVVDAERAMRQGTVFAACSDGAHLANRVPLRFLLSKRQGFERQVSAGGVLARGHGDEAEFALIRTLPRAQTAGDGERADDDEAHDEPAANEVADLPVADGPEFEDARASQDRRGQPDRRQRDLPPPGGVDRRRGGNRRQRRRRRSGRWGAEGRLELPKGKLEPGETPEQAAIREVREELGIAEALVVDGTLATNHYVFRTPDNRMIFKTVHYFLLRCPEGEPRFSPRREEGIVSVEWWPGQRAIAQVAFKNLRPVLERAWELLQRP